MDEDIEKIARRIIALAKKSKSASTPEEAAAFGTKAQSMLLEYNLSMDDLDEKAITSGRIDEEFEGGRHEWQKELWGAVARLNFCFYDNVRTIKMVSHRGRGVRYVFQHRVIGRKVNVAATKVLATYLEDAIDREVFRIKTSRLRQPDAKWEMSFRAGAANAIVIKLYDRRQQLLSDEQQKNQAEINEAMEGVADGMTMTVVTFIDAETDANIDMAYGRGTAAAWAAIRQREATEEREKEESYTKWAAAHPEAARRAEARRYQAEQDRKRKAANKYWGKHDMFSFREGRQVGATIGIDPQVDAGQNKKIGGAS